MGLLSFMKGAGKNVFDRDSADDKKTEAIAEHLNKFNLMVGGKVQAAYVGDGTVDLTGEMNSELACKRLVATVGNIEGVEKVNDMVKINQPEASPVAETEGEVGVTAMAAAPEAEIATATVRMYEVQAGDTLSAIAGEMYGDVMQYPKIFEANQPMLESPDEIYPGQQLVIPV